tara:strand:- start:487 stop:930 length:444 start_codon:yes stop_codon:yes gene_type:complete
MSILEKIKNDMYSAMKSGEKDKAGTLRVLMSNLKNFEIDNKNKLSDSDGIRIIKKLVKQRKDSTEIYKNANRLDLANKEEFELNILSSYLPQMFSEEEIRLLIEDIVQETGAKELSDIGKVMPKVMQRGAGKIDGKIANLILRDLLE